MRVIFVVATDLVKDKRTGKVSLGQETMWACDMAIFLAKQSHYDDRVDMAAGIAGAEYNHVFMAELMAQYIRAKDSSVRVWPTQAPEFTTSGEMQQMAFTVVANWKITEICLVVKFPHSLRAVALLKHWLRFFNVQNQVEVRVKIHRSIWWKIPYRMFVYEPAAWAKNKLKLWWETL